MSIYQKYFNCGDDCQISMSLKTHIIFIMQQKKMSKVYYKLSVVYSFPSLTGELV